MATQCRKIRPPNPKRDDLLEVLKHFSTALASIPDLKSLAKMILETVIQTTGVEKASLFLINEEREATI